MPLKMYDVNKAGGARQFISSELLTRKSGKTVRIQLSNILLYIDMCNYIYDYSTYVNEHVNMFLSCSCTSTGITLN